MFLFAMNAPDGSLRYSRHISAYRVIARTGKHSDYNRLKLRSNHIQPAWLDLSVGHLDQAFGWRLVLRVRGLWFQQCQNAGRDQCSLLLLLQEDQHQCLDAHQRCPQCWRLPLLEQRHLSMLRHCLRKRECSCPATHHSDTHKSAPHWQALRLGDHFRETRWSVRSRPLQALHALLGPAIDALEERDLGDRLGPNGPYIFPINRQSFQRNNQKPLCGLKW